MGRQPCWWAPADLWGSFMPPFPPGGSEGRWWVGQGRTPAGEVAVLAAGACVSTGSLCSPEVAQASQPGAPSCPAPTRASPGRGPRPEEDYADSLMDKIGSRPEEQQGKSPGGALVQREHGLGLVLGGGGLGWGRRCDQSRTGH